MSPRTSLVLTLTLCGLMAPVVAQDTPPTPSTDATTPDRFRDLTPPEVTGESEPLVCPDRPPRPAWAENLDGWEVQRSLLLSAIYEARSYEAIVATGDCSCANRAPSWDVADAEYQENYAALDLQAQTDAESEFRRLKNDLRREARAICREQGNW